MELICETSPNSPTTKQNSEFTTNSEVSYVITKLSYVRGGSLQKVIDKVSNEGLLPGPFADPELRAKYHKVLLIPLGA